MRNNSDYIKKSKVKVKLSQQQAVEVYRVVRCRGSCIDSRLIDGGKVIRLKRRPRYTPRSILSLSDTHFC
jgi:hypothetical protein